MSLSRELQASLDSLRAALGDDFDAADLLQIVDGLRDDNVERLIRDATVLVRVGECVRIAGSGVVASRSTRDLGHGGMAQTRGHRNAVSLIQDLTGTTRADATKQVRLGEALLDAAVSAEVPGVSDGAADGELDGGADDFPEGAPPRPVAMRPWHAVLGDAHLSGRLSKDEHDAIRRGLGDPPVGRREGDAGTVGESDPESEDAEADAATDQATVDAATDAAAIAAWAVAAEHLIIEATDRTAEELFVAARAVRDMLDPVGAEDRFDARFAKRSYSRWSDRDGARHARIDFDDEGAAWWDAVIDAALRPRRGGPTFVDADEAARAKELADDPRTNDQLAYDLVMDVFRAGTLADAEQVFGARQAGVRVIVTADAVTDDRAGMAAVALLEDDSTPLPAWLASQRACNTGMIECTLDLQGNPLFLGREERLFTAKQKLVLAVRDGGCRWRDCDRPASYCEAHHIDHYHDGGRTDVDRGVLLCRFHHMELHHGRWRITRAGRDDFVLHPPPGRGDPVVLRTRLARRYAFGDLAPPPRRFRTAA